MSEKHNPNYYKAGDGTDVLDFVMKHKLPFAEGCVVKYIARSVSGKPGESRLDDLQKAKVYLDRMIEAEKEAEHLGLNVALAKDYAPMVAVDVPKPRKQKRGRGKK
jgi:hypothetical protein